MKKFLRKLCVAVSRCSGFWFVLYRTYHFLTKRYLLVIFTYHRVVNTDKTSRFYMFYEKGLDYKIFARHLAIIKKYYDIIDLDRFQNILNGTEKLEKHSALITFDDADSDFPEYILPILTEMNVPAVVFAPTDFIGTTKKFWHVRVSDIISNINPENWVQMQNAIKNQPLLDEIRKLINSPYPDTEDRKAIMARSLNARLDRLNHEQIDVIIARWEEMVNIQKTSDIHCMSWDDLKKLENHEISVQSHGALHRKLAILNKEQLEYELIDSKKKLESRLRKSVYAICYPQGSFDDKVIDTVLDCGYHLGFTTHPGACKYPLGKREKLRLPRYGLDSESVAEINFAVGRIALTELTKR